MKRVLGFLILCIASTAATAQIWELIVEDRVGITEYLRDSTRLTKNKNGEEIIVSVRRINLLDQKTQRVTSVLADKIYIKVVDCSLKKGKIVKLNKHDQFDSESDFSFGNASINSKTAEKLCSLYASLSANQGKGL